MTQMCVNPLQAGSFPQPHFHINKMVFMWKHSFYTKGTVHWIKQSLLLGKSSKLRVNSKGYFLGISSHVASPLSEQHPCYSTKHKTNGYMFTGGVLGAKSAACYKQLKSSTNLQRLLFLPLRVSRLAASQPDMATAPPSTIRLYRGWGKLLSTSSGRR